MRVVVIAQTTQRAMIRRPRRASRTRRACGTSCSIGTCSPGRSGRAVIAIGTGGTVGTLRPCRTGRTSGAHQVRGMKTIDTVRVQTAARALRTYGGGCLCPGVVGPIEMEAGTGSIQIVCV